MLLLLEGKEIMESPEQEDTFGKADQKSASMERLTVNEIQDWCIPAVTGAERGTEARESSEKMELTGDVMSDCCVADNQGDNAGGEDGNSGDWIGSLVEG